MDKTKGGSPSVRTFYRKWLKQSIVGLAAVVITAGLSGCAEKTEDMSAKASTDEPVHLVFHHTGAFSDADFQLWFAGPLSKKYPNITVEFAKKDDGIKLEDLVAGGTAPDLIATADGKIRQLQQLDIVEDLTPMLKKHNFDLQRFSPDLIKMVQSYSDKGELLALPAVYSTKALFYNKDLFDKFAVPYPTDGMLWEDVIGLAKKLARQDGKTVYQGLDFDQLHRFGAPFSMALLDPKTKQPALQQGGWKTLFELAKQIYDIPNNLPKKPAKDYTDVFFKDRTLAMLAAQSNLLSNAIVAIPQGLKLGIVQYPSFKEKPGDFGKLNADVITISRTSKHKDAAMAVLQTLFSDDVQKDIVRQTASVSPLGNPEVNKQIGAGVPQLSGINLSAVANYRGTLAEPQSEYYDELKSALNNLFVKDYLPAGADLNNVLQKGDEQFSQIIAGVGK